MAIGKLEEVDIRKLWKYEQYDFCVGLSKKENIDITLVNKDSVIGVELYITDNKELFDKLYQRKNKIENDLELKLDWRRLNKGKASRIVTFIKWLNFDDHGNYNELMNKTIDLAVLMRDVFKKYLYY